MKEVAVFWDVATSGPVQVYPDQEVLTASVTTAMRHRPDDGGSKNL
jgi:hypothetical protein